jgi:hypothetical protein
MTSKADIASWLEVAKSRRCAYLVVLCDTFDYDDYPVYCATAAEARTAIAKDEKNMAKLMECYDLSLDIDAQLAEHRARHFPPMKDT